MADSPVSLFIPDHPSSLRSIRQKLTEARDARRNNIANGAADDFPSYRERVGEIRGLELALRICAEVEQDMRN